MFCKMFLLLALCSLLLLGADAQSLVHMSEQVAKAQNLFAEHVTEENKSYLQLVYANFLPARILSRQPHNQDLSYVELLYLETMDQALNEVNKDSEEVVKILKLAAKATDTALAPVTEVVNLECKPKNLDESTCDGLIRQKLGNDEDRVLLLLDKSYGAAEALLSKDFVLSKLVYQDEVLEYLRINPDAAKYVVVVADWLRQLVNTYPQSFDTS